MPDRVHSSPERASTTPQERGTSGGPTTGGLAAGLAHRFERDVDLESVDRLASSGWQAVPPGAGGLGMGGLGLPLQLSSAPGGPEQRVAQADPEDGGLALEGPEVELPTTGGAPLDEEIRSEMEARFETDFATVRVHESDAVSRLGAHALTRGEHIHFAPGRYVPSTEAGQQLLAHELTHVVQQRQGRVQPTTSVGGLPVNDDPGLESEADGAGLRGGTGTAPDRVVQGKFVLELGLPAKGPLGFDQQVRGATVNAVNPKTRQEEAPDPDDARRITTMVTGKRLTELYAASVGSLEWQASQLSSGQRGVHADILRRVEEAIARDPDKAGRQLQGEGAASGAKLDEVKVATGFIDAALQAWLAQHPEVAQRPRSGAIVGRPPKLETTGQESTGQETTGQETTGQETTGQETTGQDGEDRLVKTRPRSGAIVGRPPKLETPELETPELDTTEQETSKLETSKQDTTEQDGEARVVKTRPRSGAIVGRPPELETAEPETAELEDKSDEPETIRDEERIAALGSLPSSRLTPETVPATTAREDWAEWLAMPNLPGAQLDIFGGMFQSAWEAKSSAVAPKGTETSGEDGGVDPRAAALEAAAAEHVAAWQALSRSESIDRYRLALPLLDKWSPDQLQAWLIKKGQSTGTSKAAPPPETSSTQPAARVVRLRLADEVGALQTGLKLAIESLQTDDQSVVPPEASRLLAQIAENKDPITVLAELGAPVSGWDRKLLDGGDVAGLRAQLTELLVARLGPTTPPRTSEEPAPTPETVRARLERRLRAFVETGGISDGRQQEETGVVPREGETTTPRTRSEDPRPTELSALEIDSVDWTAWSEADSVLADQLLLARLELAQSLGPDPTTEQRQKAADELASARVRLGREDEVEAWLVARPLVDSRSESQLAAHLGQSGGRETSGG